MSILKTYLCGLCMAIVVLAAAPSHAQQPGAAATGMAAVGPTHTLLLPLNKAEVFALPADARDVLVSNPEITDVVMRTPRRAYVLARGIGDTNVFFFDADGEPILRLEVNVERDLTGLRTALATVLPDEPITVTAVNENIVLSGTASTAKAAEDARLIARRFVAEDDELVNMIGIDADQQVLLRVRVAEVSRDVVKELGVNSAFTIRGDDGGVSFDAGLEISPDSFGVATFDFVGGAFDALEISIDALESQGLVKTLAEPSLSAISGENANLLVGGEFPVPIDVTTDGSGNVSTDIEFKQFGIVLTFTPVVLNSGLISLKVSTEVSALNFGDAAFTFVTAVGEIIIPALDVNRAETTVELPSGGSLVIAGLLQDDISNALSGLPGLKDIPILGTLFRSTAFQRNETELVFTVTPYLVQSTSEDSIALPTDGFAPASDLDMYLLGRLHDVYAKPGEKQASGRLMGPIGYIME